jgi:hypothetical protein
VSTRDRLLGRAIPPTTVTIRADFSPESEAVFAEVEAASQALQYARADGADLTTARERLEAASAALGPYVEVMQAAVLPPHEYDALVDDHPPTDEQRKLGAAFNLDTFPAALLAACLQQDGQPVMPAQDWQAWAKTPGAVASGELNALFNVCVNVNDRSPSVHVGKGPAQISS